MLPLLAGVSKWDGIYWCWAYIFPLTLKSHSRLYAWDLCTYVHQKKSSRVSIAVRFIITPLETLQMPISILHCGIFTWQIVDIIEIPKPPLHTITGWISWTKLSKRNQTTKNTRTPFNLYKVQEQAKLIYGEQNWNSFLMRKLKLAERRQQRTFWSNENAPYLVWTGVYLSWWIYTLLKTWWTVHLRPGHLTIGKFYPN